MSERANLDLEGTPLAQATKCDEVQREAVLDVVEVLRMQERSSSPADGPRHDTKL